MWTGREETAGCARTPAELVVMESGSLAATMPTPSVGNLNVTKSSKVHIGPKFVSVTQNVQNAEMLKGRFLGLDLVSTKQARRLRCSVAVFVCWAFLVASGLVIYLIYVAMPGQKLRLDIGLNETWYLRRGDWQAMPPYDIDFLQLPVPYVLVGHSAANYCNEKYKCVEQMLVIQQDHLRRDLSDIGPNFLVGGGGFVFEGRGANVFGAMVSSWNHRSISIMFMGNYLNDKPDTEQLDHVDILLEVLVKEGVLRPDYTLLELPLPKYLWHIIKNSTRTERLSCAAALAVLLICVGLIGYFSTRTTQAQDSVDRAPHEWNISREMWLAKPQNYTNYTYHYQPLVLVVVQNTVGPQCHRFKSCAAELRNLQGWYLKDHGYDIPYNFAIGNDGRVYENRGWSVEGAHTLGFNRCSVGLGFLGDYREEMPNYATFTAAQENHTLLLLEEGVRRGHLRRDFLVVGARDLTSTASPGSNLYNAIRRWRNYDHQARFKGLTCAQIHQKYADTPLYDVDAL